MKQGIVINPGSSKELYDAMKFLLDNEDIAKWVEEQK